MPRRRQRWLLQLAVLLSALLAPLVAAADSSAITGLASLSPSSAPLSSSSSTSSAPLPSASSSSTCTHITQRVSWSAMSADEQSNWAQALHCLAATPWRSSPRWNAQHQGWGVASANANASVYDEFARTHAAFDDDIHENAAFLPWHRWIVVLLEDALRTHCAYPGPTPYWDWSPNVLALSESPIFNASSPIGGDGAPITRGAFSNFRVQHPAPHYLARNFSLGGQYMGEAREWMSGQMVRVALERPTFERFQGSVEEMHNRVHNFVGGDLAAKFCLDRENGTDADARKRDDDDGEGGEGGMEMDDTVDVCHGEFTPNDPLFYMHHAQIDRLWAEWQASAPAQNSSAYDPRNDTHALPFGDLSSPKTIAFLSRPIEALREPPFCYEYV